MAIVSTVEVYVGEDIPIVVTLNPVEDITGMSFRFTVALYANAPGAKIISKACTLLTPASGTLKAQLDSADTLNVEPGTYFWDVYRIDSGYNRMVACGDFLLKPGARFPA